MTAQLGTAEDWLLDLELFGMHFGLERIGALADRLANPERAFASVHVVGSNGKSSTTRFTAALLQEHGLRTGAYLSPHLVSFAERVRVDGEDLDPEAFADAVDAVRAVVAEVPGVTQFEALTAAALLALARAGVQVAVVEAGLGGRYDATNVLPSQVQVLTGVGLEHTQWLGDTLEAIAEEKLDVVEPGGTLVLGHAVGPEARGVAARVAAERGARIVEADALPPADVELAAAGAFQRANFATALAAAEAFLGRPLDPAAVARAARTLVPGRMETVGQRPTTLVDGAHNPDGMRALAASLPRAPVVVLSVLADKDLPAMLAPLVALGARVVATGNANPRSVTAEALAEAARGAGIGEVVEEPEPRAALEQARALAGPDGLVVATGSLYLLADLRSDAPRKSER